MKVASVDLPSTVRRCAQREVSDDTSGPSPDDPRVSSWHYLVYKRRLSNEDVDDVPASLGGMQRVGQRAEGRGQRAQGVEMNRNAFESAQACFGAAPYQLGPLGTQWPETKLPCLLPRGDQSWGLDSVWIEPHAQICWEDFEGAPFRGQDALHVRAYLVYVANSLGSACQGSKDEPPTPINAHPRCGGHSMRIKHRERQ